MENKYFRNFDLAAYSPHLLWSSSYYKRAACPRLMHDYLASSRLLDYNAPELRHKQEHLLTHLTKQKEQLKVLHNFVAKLPQCYSRNDDMPASEVLADGCGQCNTKTVLLMALARSAGIPCRLHAYKVYREVQRERVPGWMLRFAPRTTVFLWPEFLIAKHWQPLQELVHEKDQEWDSCPFDGACYLDTPLRSEWIAEDQGIWDSPDDYFAKHKPTVHGWRMLGWNAIGRRMLNKRYSRFAE